MTADARPAARARTGFQAIPQLAELADYTIAFTIRAIADLGIADHLASGPRGLADLAAATATHAPSLQRALRALVGPGVFAEPEPDVFELTALGQPLRSDHPLSMRAAFTLSQPEIAAWAHLDYSIRTGNAAFGDVHGEGYWEYLTGHPDARIAFHHSQEAMSRLELLTVVRAYDWPAVGTLVDVGGGSGTFLAGLLARHRGLHGIVFDLPDVVAGAPAILAAAGVGDRCEVAGGSFFDTQVPASAGGYLLKRVLYGWDDEHAAEILRAVRSAMRPGSRLLIFEPVLREGDSLSASMDLLMLTLSAGRVRTRDELAELLGAAGLRLTRLIETRMYPIIEAVTVPPDESGG
jgi:O-methyltransferase domain